ncbi:MAG: restriction endonuclease subunit S, partial [Enterovibrio sp.]
KITNGYVGPTRDLFHDDGVRYLQSLHIKNNNIDFHTPYFVTKEWSNEKAKSILQYGDVLVVQTGDIGQVAAVPEEFVGCNCHALIIISPNFKIDGFFLSWVLNSDYGAHNLKAIQTGALHPHLNCGLVKTIKIAFPPICEQKSIITYFEDKLNRFDLLTGKVNDAVKLLKERRTALISAAVTGKIDVRDFVAPPASQEEQA